MKQAQGSSPSWAGMTLSSPFKKFLKSILRLKPVQWLRYNQISQNLAALARTLLIRMTGNRFLVKTSLTLCKNTERYAALFGKSENNLKIWLSPIRNELGFPLGRIYNEKFESVDAEVLYAAVRHFKPQKIIEIGCGHSTFFALDAIRKNERGEIVCIDPEPRRRLPRQARYLACKIEEAPLSLFENLEKDDILFIDSSHTKEEATYHAQEILPRLKPGVVVHHHDILYPYEPVYDEEPVILDFYLNQRNRWEILLGSAYLRHRHRDLLYGMFPSFRINEQRAGGSLWTRKTC